MLSVTGSSEEQWRSQNILQGCVTPNCLSSSETAILCCFRIITRPTVGAALSVAPRPSVRPSRASYFLEIGKPQKLPIYWKHSPGQE